MKKEQTNKIRQEFDGEMYFELIEIGGEKVEHVGFRSKDGSFEELLNVLPETIQLPQKAKIIVEFTNLKSHKK